MPSVLYPSQAIRPYIGGLTYQHILSPTLVLTEMLQQQQEPAGYKSLYVEYTKLIIAAAARVNLPFNLTLT